MKKHLLIFLCFISNVLVLLAQGTPGQWGDQGNGTYINPILNADYSDPDVIRVGDKYYMVASDFHFLGMQVLESADMVNWKLISQIYHRFDFPGWNDNQQYAGGAWAPAIRYHDNKFWVFFCTPKEGLFMSNAINPTGPWSPLHLVEKVEKWEDPCPFWDEDGQAYLGRSRHGAGPIIIHKMSADGTRLLDEGTTVYTGPVAEGTKIFKKDGFYYLSIPEGGVGTGWQTILRSKNIYGPYEKKVVLEQGSTTINGPHQGAIVDTPDGQWAFFHFQHHDALGRVVHLQPMHWENGWPVIGVDLDRNGTGEPVYVWQKPIESKTIFAPQTNDDFSNITIERSKGAILRFETNYFGFRGGKHASLYEHFRISNVKAECSDHYAIFMDGYEEKPIRDIEIEHFHVQKAVYPYYLRCTESIRLKDATVNGKSLPENPEEHKERVTLDVY